MEPDFPALRRLNPDAVGWIRLADTPIDYPIVQERRGDYYLSHNFSRESSRHGAIALDANTPFVFPDRRNRLRGHNMTDGSMFRALTAYLDPSFCAAQAPIRLFADSGHYAVQLWAALRVPYAEEYLSLVPEEPLAFAKWSSVIKKRSLYRTELIPEIGDRHIVFCTCETEGTDGLAHGDVLLFGTVIDCP